MADQADRELAVLEARKDIHPVNLVQEEVTRMNGHPTRGTRRAIFLLAAAPRCPRFFSSLARRCLILALEPVYSAVCAGYKQMWPLACLLPPLQLFLIRNRCFLAVSSFFLLAVFTGVSLVWALFVGCTRMMALVGCLSFQGKRCCVKSQEFWTIGYVIFTVFDNINDQVESDFYVTYFTFGIMKSSSVPLYI